MLLFFGAISYQRCHFAATVIIQVLTQIVAVLLTQDMHDTGPENSQSLKLQAYGQLTRLGWWIWMQCSRSE